MRGPQSQNSPLPVPFSTAPRGCDACACRVEFRAPAVTFLNQILELAATQRRLRLGPAVEIIRNFNCGLHRTTPNWHKTVNPYLWKITPEMQAPDCGGSRSPHYS